MRRLLSLLLVLILISCETKTSPSLKIGEWWAKMDVSENQILPFNFSLSKADGTNSYVMKIRNADEVITVDEITIKKDSIFIQMPVFEGYIVGTFKDEHIQGSFVKESLDRVVPFQADFGNRPRFETNVDAEVNVSGIWEVDFDYDGSEPYPGKGIFIQDGNKVTGTFRTTTGDYRYLEGVVSSDTLKLSTFDGAHAFLFMGKATDSTLNGKFYSGNHHVEHFKAKRNENFELPDANTLTFLKEGYDSFDFSFPNAKGEMVGLQDKQFENKVVLVQIMGTWCPNCLDETKFYVDYLNKNPNEDLQIVALAFEYAKTKEKAFKSIERLRDRVGVQYPILLAQIGTSSKTKANEKLPMLNHVLSYPTTIYIDKRGEVRKIHTGFNGPATGLKHEQFKEEFSDTLEELLSESATD